jgi:magnesium chelatase subunit D
MEDAALICALIALDGARLGGALLEGASGPGHDAWLADLSRLGARPFPIPSSASDDRLTGGLDLSATLAAGSPMMQKGLLETARGGVIILHGAERLESSRAALIAAEIDTNRTAAVALADVRSEDETVPTVLAERLAFRIDLGMGYETPGLDQDAIAAARKRLRRVKCPHAIIDELCATAFALGTGLRAAQFALAAARGIASLNEHGAVTENDAALAARLTLAHRATQLPADDDEESGREPDTQNHEERSQSSSEDLREILLEAVRPALPPQLLADLAAGAARISGGRGKGAKARKAKAQRGRPIAARRGNIDRGARLDLIATLRAAAPWQPLRGRDASQTRIHVRRDDFRVRRFKQLARSTAIFAVDASGSAALQRLGEAKGAVELILAECYVRRDQAALIAFRGKTADILLPPTRSLERARRALAALPGGGGTPLTAALEAAQAVAAQVERAGQRPVIVLLTDGRANVMRDGRGNRALAMEEALAAARRFAGDGRAALVIDIASDARSDAKRLAEALGARYVALPRGQAKAIAAPVRAAMRAGR